MNRSKTDEELAKEAALKKDANPDNTGPASSEKLNAKQAFFDQEATTKEEAQDSPKSTENGETQSPGKDQHGKDDLNGWQNQDDSHLDYAPKLVEDAQLLGHHPRFSRNRKMALCIVYVLLCILSSILISVTLFQFLQGCADTSELFAISDSLEQTIAYDDIVLTDSDHCPPTYYPMPLGVWPGTSEGCFCNDTMALTKGKCTSSNLKGGKCVQIDPIPSKDIYNLSTNQSLCYKILNDHSYYRKPDCKTGYKICGNRYCVKKSENCPVTDISLQKNNSTGLFNLSLTRHKTAGPLRKLEANFAPVVNRITNEVTLPDYYHYSVIKSIGSDEVNQLLKANQLSKVIQLPLWKNSSITLNQISQPELRYGEGRCGKLVKLSHDFEDDDLKIPPIWFTLLTAVAILHVSAQIMSGIMLNDMSKEINSKILTEFQYLAYFHFLVMFLLVVSSVLLGHLVSNIERLDDYAYDTLWDSKCLVQLDSKQIYENFDKSRAGSACADGEINLIGFTCTMLFFIALIKVLGAMWLKKFYSGPERINLNED